MRIWGADERGQALVEFALTIAWSLPLLVFGVLILGQAVNTRHAIQCAAREGARVGAEVAVQWFPMGTARRLARDRIKEVLEDRGLEPNRARISFDGSSGGYERGGMFRVTVKYRYRLPAGDIPLLRRVPGWRPWLDLEAEIGYRIQRHKARWRW
jgi:hypothetical protein